MRVVVPPADPVNVMFVPASTDPIVLLKAWVLTSPGVLVLPRVMVPPVRENPLVLNWMPAARTPPASTWTFPPRPRMPNTAVVVDRFDHGSGV